MTSSKADTKKNPIFAPKNNVLLSLFLLQLLFALSVFGGALGIITRDDTGLRKRYLIELGVRQPYPRRGGRGGRGRKGGGVGSGGSGDSNQLTHQFVAYFALVISVIFLIYNPTIIFIYFRKKLNLNSAMWWSGVFCGLFLVSTILTGVWAESIQHFSPLNLPVVAAVFLGTIFLVVVLTVSVVYIWSVRRNVIREQTFTPAPIVGLQYPESSFSQGSYTALIASPGVVGQFKYQEPGQAPLRHEWIVTPAPGGQQQPHPEKSQYGHHCEQAPPGHQWVPAPAQGLYDQPQLPQYNKEVDTNNDPPKMSMDEVHAPWSYPSPQYDHRNDYNKI